MQHAEEIVGLGQRELRMAQGKHRCQGERLLAREGPTGTHIYGVDPQALGTYLKRTFSLINFYVRRCD